MQSNRGDVHADERRRCRRGRCAAILVSISTVLALITAIPGLNTGIAADSHDADKPKSTSTDTPARPPGAQFDKLPERFFPETSAVVNIKAAPYNAVGDGVTDDTDAIQRAISDVMGLTKMLYFPEGTYLISKTINWSKKNSAGGDAWGFNYLQGQHVGKTTIRLKDGSFTDGQNPQAMMWCGGFGSADWFHNYIQDMTFDVGNQNPGAVALQFYSNNTGAVRNCRFIAGENSGVTGLDFGHRDMNGPLLVRNCEVSGFQRGISCARAVNGQVFEHITLRGQTRFGFENEGQSVSIRGLVSENTVPAIQTYGVLCLVDSRLTGSGEARNEPAIINYNSGRIYLRDVQTAGYSRALGDVETPDSFSARRIQGEDKPGSAGPVVTEYWSHPPTRPFSREKLPGEKLQGQKGTGDQAAGLRSGRAPKSPRLAVRETPEIPEDPLTKWANVNDFGADPTGNTDSSAAIQKAVDSGATTIFFPGFYDLSKPVIIRGEARRFVGIGGWIDYHRHSKPDFIIAEGTSPTISFEHFANTSGGFDIQADREIVFKSVGAGLIRCRKPVNLFFEDVVTDDMQFLPGQHVWARQLNVENEGTHVTNTGGALWVLGYKTERGGTLVHTKEGGTTEILGGFSYTTTAGKLAPMFVTENSRVFAFFAEVCFNGDPFESLIRETHKSETKLIKRGEGGTTPYISALPPKVTRTATPSKTRD